MSFEIESALDSNPTRIPEGYLCPISGAIMIEPVILEDGYSYEKEEIKKWLEKKDESPMTRQAIDKNIMIPNRNLASEISEFLIHHPDIHFSNLTYMPCSWMNDLTSALKKNNLEGVRNLLDKDKRLLTIPLEAGYTAWHMAVQYGSVELAYFILKRILQNQSLDILKSQNTAGGFEATHMFSLVIQSLEEDNIDMYKALLKLGANPEQIDPNSGETLLHLMVKCRNAKAIKCLLNTPVNVMQVNNKGDTPLHCAVLEDLPDMVELLLQHEPTKQFPMEIDAKNNLGKSPLYVAIERKNPNIVQALLIKGANPNVCCGELGESPLHLAIKQRDIKLVENLLFHGVVPNIQDKDGNTALHLSIKDEDKTLENLLLKAGFDPHLRNNKGVSPMDLSAASSGKLLQKFCLLQGSEKPSCGLQVLSGHTDIVYCLEKLDEGYLASGSWDKTVKIWQENKCIMTLIGHTHNVTSIQQMNKNVIASGSSDKSIKVWDLSTNSCISTLIGHAGSIRCLQRVNPVYLASGSSDKTIKIWDLDLKKCIKTLVGHTDSLNTLALCKDGNLASGSWDNSIKIWDIQTGRCIKTLKGHDGVVRCLLPWGKDQLISGSRDKTIRIWDRETGACLTILSGHTDAVNCLCFLGERYLVSGSWDKTLRVWDLVKGTLVDTYEGHTGAVNSFALEEGILFSSSDDKSIKSWEVAKLLPQENKPSFSKNF